MPVFSNISWPPGDFKLTNRMMASLAGPRWGKLLQETERSSHPGVTHNHRASATAGAAHN